jgi:hypothetical protein
MWFENAPPLEFCSDLCQPRTQILCRRPRYHRRVEKNYFSCFTNLATWEVNLRLLFYIGSQVIHLMAQQLNLLNLQPEILQDLADIHPAKLQPPDRPL